MGILYRNSQGVETPVAGLAPAGSLIPSVSLYQKGSITNTTSIASKDYVRIEITLNTPMPDTDYVVDLQTMQGHGLANAFCDAYGKTNSGFAIILANPSDNNVPANQIQVVWRAFKLMTDEDRALDEAKIEQNTKNFAPNFSATSSYAVGDYCTYQGVLYRCTTAHTAGAWVAGHFTQVTVGGTLGNIVPSDASASNKLVAKSDAVTKYNYTMAGTASLEDDIKAFVTVLIALGANTYVGFFNRGGNLGTAGNYSITVYAEEGTSTFASGYIALGAGAMGKTQYEVSYYKPAGSSEEWTIKKLVTAGEVQPLKQKYILESGVFSPIEIGANNYAYTTIQLQHTYNFNGIMFMLTPVTYVNTAYVSAAGHWGGNGESSEGWTQSDKITVFITNTHVSSQTAGFYWAIYGTEDNIVS